MTFTPEQIGQLKAPLDKKHVKPRKQGNTTVSYVEGWHAIDEANRIFGFDAWDRETVIMQETNRELVTLRSDKGEYQQWRVGYLAKVRVRVGSIIREGTGFGSGMARPEALGEAIESAAKEAETDAMKRAMMTFGNPFGLALYDKEQTNVADEAAIAKMAAIENLWDELCAIRTPQGLSSFIKDNSAAIDKFDPANVERFVRKGKELKAQFDKEAKAAAAKDERFPGDDLPPFTDAEIRMHPMNA